MNRKIIQALVSPAIVYAVCDDGTLWGQVDAPDAQWQRLNGILYDSLSALSVLNRRLDEAERQGNYADVLVACPSRVIISYPDQLNSQSRRYYAPPIPQDEMA